MRPDALASPSSNDFRFWIFDWVRSMRIAASVFPGSFFGSPKSKTCSEQSRRIQNPKLAALLLACLLGTPMGVSAAQVKPPWQQEWEKTLEAAKKEGQLTVYISGYEAVLPHFEKEFPEIKLTAVTARGNQLGRQSQLSAVLSRQGARSAQAGADPARGHGSNRVVSQKAPILGPRGAVRLQLRRLGNLRRGQLQ